MTVTDDTTDTSKKFAFRNMSSPEAGAPPEATLRWGIIGCGDVCERKSGPALCTAQRSRLVAVMRRDAAKAADFARRHGAPRSYSTVEGLLGDSEVNAVYVASPPRHHCEHALAALAAGHKVVLVEKPFGMDEGECRAVVAAAEAAGARVYVAYYRRFYPKWQAAKALLAAGCIGQVLGARLQMCSEAAASGWRVDPALSAGGHFVDVGSHRIDMLLYLLGATPVRVHGFARNELGHHGAENDVAFTMLLSSGALVTGSFHYHTPPQRDVLELFGSRGTMTFDPWDGTDFSVCTSAGARTTHSHPTPSPVHLPFVQELVWHALGARPGDPEQRASPVLDAGLRADHVHGGQGTLATQVIDAVLGPVRERVRATS